MGIVPLNNGACQGRTGGHSTRMLPVMAARRARAVPRSAWPSGRCLKKSDGVSSSDSRASKAEGYTRKNGGYLEQEKAFGSDGDDQIAREQGYRTKVGGDIEGGEDYRMAATSADLGKSGFYLPSRAGCYFCGRLFLAWMPLALPNAEVASKLLDSKNGPQQSARP